MITGPGIKDEGKAGLPQPLFVTSHGATINGWGAGCRGIEIVRIEFHF
jgi:hypothetical protein